MNRTDIRNLKRSVRQQHNSEAMRALLERSILFGHRRLALIRCVQLEQMGAQPSPEHLRYCQAVADSMPRQALEQILRQAGNDSSRKPDDDHA